MVCSQSGRRAGKLNLEGSGQLLFPADHLTFIQGLFSQPKIWPFAKYANMLGQHVIDMLQKLNVCVKKSEPAATVMLGWNYAVLPPIILYLKNK